MQRLMHITKKIINIFHRNFLQKVAQHLRKDFTQVYRTSILKINNNKN